MNRLLDPLRAIAGLFFDDRSLAITVLAILATTAILLDRSWFDGPEAMAFLVGGIIAALLENVLRTARLVSFETHRAPAETATARPEGLLKTPNQGVEP